MNSQNLDKVFGALANGHRRAIIYELSLRPHSIKQLSEKLSLSFQAIHKHLNVLEETDVIMRRKTGRTNYIALKKKTLQQVQKWIMQFNPYWGNDQETFENYLDNLSKHS